jgi:hypothetical protein
VDLESSLKSKQALARAREVIIIQDREGDIYEQFCMIPDARTYLLIRAKTNRLLSGQNRLFEHLFQLPKQGEYQLPLEGDPRRGIKKRTATTIEVRFGKVSITRNHYNDRTMPERKELYSIEARENTKGVENPILWRLLTTWPVESLKGPPCFA